MLKGLAVGLAGVAIVAAAVIAVTRASVDDTGRAQSAGPVPDLPREAASASGRAPADENAAQPAVGTKTELGVFEKIRGWIVYPIDYRLEAVNPSDPAERQTLELPAGLDVLLSGGGAGGGGGPSPAGWSADGKSLALSSEYHGDAFVMGTDGSVARVNAGPGGCCNFVVTPWLSPDGKTALLRVGREEIDYADLAATFSDRRRLDPPLPAGRSGWMSTWLADGRRVAFVSEGQGGDKPTLHVADFSSGTHRRLRDLDVGHIRHIISSPEGSELLVVGGAPLPRNLPLNPLVSPRPTSLYILDADGSGVRTIASGYYVAAAWSPDGSQIAAIEYDGSRKLVVMDADGTSKRVLVELPADELFTGLAWHPLPDN